VLITCNIMSWVLLSLQRNESDAAAEVLKRRQSELECRRDALTQQVKFD